MSLCRLPDGSIGVRNTNDDVEDRLLVISGVDLADWLARIKAGAFDDLASG